MNNAIFLISCPDARGINARVSQFIFGHNGNIEHSDQHIDSQTNTFFMRIEWSLKGFTIPKEKIYEAFSPIVDEFRMNVTLHFTEKQTRMALFVSRHLHCLFDLLMRHKSGQFHCQIPLIISNHHDARELADFFNIRFFHFPVTAENKTSQEEEQLKVLKEEHVDLIVFARYMQIVSPRFVSLFANRVINIHHSFLPAFVGRNPYQQAHTKGVKIIGATSHYITEALDAGPIIEQDTVRVSHRDSLDDIVRKGEDLERGVLSRAVKWHLERKILIYNNKTVIFD